MRAEEIVDAIARAIEYVGIGLIVVGAAVSLVAFLAGVARRAPFDPVYRSFRRDLGRSILLGLEFLVAADIIRTVAVSPTLESVIVLGIIVLIRTLLSFSLEAEIDGRWPWRAAEQSQRSP